MARAGARQQPQSAEDDREERDLSELVKALGETDVVVKLYEIDRMGRQVFRDMLPLELLRSGQLELYIRERFPGGGSFLVRVLKQGRYVKGGNKMVHVGAENDTTVEYADSPSGNMQFEMIKMQMQMQKESSDRTMQMFQGFNTSMMSLVTAILSSNKPMDPASLIALMNSGGGQKGGLEQMKDAILIVKELGAGGGADDPMTAIATSAVNRLIDKAIPGALAPAAAATPNLPPATMAAKDTAAVTLTAATSNSAPGAESNEGAELAARRAFLDELKWAAEKTATDDFDDEVDFWAELIEKCQTSRLECRWILSIVKSFPWETVHDGLVRADKAIAEEPYLTFFKKLYELLRQETPA